METMQFTAPKDHNNEEWKKKNYGPAALVTVLLLGLAFLAGNSYNSYGHTAPDGSVWDSWVPFYVQLKNDTPYAVVSSEMTHRK